MKLLLSTGVKHQIVLSLIVLTQPNSKSFMDTVVHFGQLISKWCFACSEVFSSLPLSLWNAFVL